MPNWSKLASLVLENLIFELFQFYVFVALKVLFFRNLFMLYWNSLPTPTWCSKRVYLNVAE